MSAETEIEKKTGLVLRFLNWLGLRDYLARGLKSLDTYPKRYAWLILWFSLFVASGKPSYFMRRLLDAPPIETYSQLLPQLYKQVGFRPIWWALLFALLSFALTLCLDHWIEGLVKSTRGDASESDLLNDLLLTHCGIVKVYPGKRGQATEQLYANDMRKDATESEIAYLLMISGHEIIGKGTDSLLYNVLKGKSVQAVLMDPVAGRNVLEERVRFLKLERDRAVTVDRLISEIQQTAACLNGMKGESIGPEVRYAEVHPSFRIIIFKHCLYVSPYGPSQHGHESPTFRIERSVDPGKRSGWEMAFERVFQTAWERGNREPSKPKKAQRDQKTSR